MVDQKHIQSLVEQTLNDVLTGAMPGLCEQIAQRVVKKLAEQSADQIPVADSAILNAAQAAVQAGTTQVQILDAMIEGADHFATRTALFVVRGANAVGWRARGFLDDEGVKTSPLELSEGLASQAIARRCPVTGPASEFMPGFAKQFGTPKEAAAVYPLVVRDKVVAIIYADGGTADHHFDRPAMEALVRSTALWLEVFATRKVTGAVAAQEAANVAPQPAPPVATTQPFAVQPVQPTLPPPPSFQPAPQPVAVMAAAASVAPNMVPAASSASVATLEATPVIEVPVMAPVAVPVTKDDEIRTKARRFAKLLVDEIRLYNQAKVSEGRQNHDLYDRLKDDIEKSRASYEKRYGNTPAKDGDYFNHELVRILADNDPALFGGNFPR